MTHEHLFKADTSLYNNRMLGHICNLLENEISNQRLHTNEEIKKIISMRNKRSRAHGVEVESNMSGRFARILATVRIMATRGVLYLKANVALDA